MDTIQIEVYPLQVVVKPDPSMLPYIREFSSNYILFQEYWDKRQKRKVRTPIAGYVFFTKDRREIRFMRTMLDDFLGFLKLRGLEVDRDFFIEVFDTNNVVDNIYPTIKEGWKPRGEQQDVIDFAGQFDTGPVLLHLVGGGGKAGRHGTLISTPAGWKKIEDIKIGDIIHNEFGTTNMVTAIHPQGEKEIFRVHFRDGRYSDVTEEHLWYIIGSNQKGSVKTTKEILDYIGEGGYRGWKTEDRHRGQYVPLVKPVEYPEKELPLHPYVLGVFIGDGHFGKHSTRLTINKDDMDIFDAIEQLRPQGDISKKKLHNRGCFEISFKNKNSNEASELTKTLRSLNLSCLRSWEKTIPEIYMYSSVEQRLDLVRGLLDTDGYVGECGSISFTTTSKVLAEQFKTLIHSLGGMAKVVEKRKFFTLHGVKKPGRVSYNVNVRHPLPSSLVRAKRKKARCNDNNQYAKTMKLQIMKIERVGKDFATCITVDNPTSLYVMSDYIVTHNSYTSMEIVSRQKERFVGVMRPTLIGVKEDEGWLNDFRKSYDITKDEICRVQGTPELKSLINICLARGYNPYKAILISNKTLMNFIKNYEDYPPDEFFDLGYSCTPMDFPKVLGVNSFVIDEAHFDHHLNCRFASYFNLRRLIGATATPNFDDKFKDKMVNFLFPKERRYVQKHNSVHIQPIAYHYSLTRPEKIRVEGFRGYNHIKFEQSLYKRASTQTSYHEMIRRLIETYHDVKLKDYPQLKCLVTVASIQAAYKLRDFLAEAYPDRVVTSYVADDSVSNLYNSDICVSTVQGAGTGHDIANLATVIMTNAINSSTTNLQCAWRLRKMNIPVEHSFVYLVCDDIPSHRKYDMKKKTDTFKGKTLPVRDVQSNYHVVT